MPSAYTNPGNAFDGNPATFASATVTADIATCVWGTWGSASGQYTALFLSIDNEIAQPGTAVSSAWLGYSTDGGATWQTIYSVSGANLVRGRHTDTVILPPGTNLANLQVRASIQTTAGTTSQHRVYEISTLG